MIYVIASDGDIQEGVTAEASSLAGHQELGNLVVIYDDNEISIEDNTDIAFTEDVLARYEAYGWHTQHIDWVQPGKRDEPASYRENLGTLADALNAARAETSKPSIISLRTIIGWPSPTKQNTGGIHGSALGEDELGALKTLLGFSPDEQFAAAQEALDHSTQAAVRGQREHEQWQRQFEAWAQALPDRKELFDQLSRRGLPDGWTDALPTFEAGSKIATRAASGKVLEAIGPKLPMLWGGSADLAGSNNTTMAEATSFVPESKSTEKFPGDKYGRTLHFGIREHAMGAIMNGILLHGGTRVYGGTFLVFSDYMRPPVRLAAIMHLPAIYVWTHDSIGLGEDGPTHQPVEQLAALRAIPDLAVVRPADGNETSWAWRRALETTDHPVALALSRQGLPVVERGEGEATATSLGSAAGTMRGGYVLADTDGPADVLLIATGSEVDLALQARAALSDQGVAARVVSMPCVEWFRAEPIEYRDAVLPPTVGARVVIEAGIAQPWYEFTGGKGQFVTLEHFGASASGEVLFEQFGFTVDAVVDAARDAIDEARTN